MKVKFGEKEIDVRGAITFFEEGTDRRINIYGTAGLPYVKLRELIGYNKDFYEKYLDKGICTWGNNYLLDGANGYLIKESPRKIVHHYSEWGWTLNAKGIWVCYVVTPDFNNMESNG